MFGLIPLSCLCRLLSTDLHCLLFLTVTFMPPVVSTTVHLETTLSASPSPQSIYGVTSIFSHLCVGVPSSGDPQEANDDCAVLGRVDFQALAVAPG
ncbi:MAG: hypothetical protein J07HQX50_01553 [Haloquadratum sp. J07HQX50]|nr:MAG: hypothetical protein J07HQX50_01553 [Haloquadratum sp. J07HQX50]